VVTGAAQTVTASSTGWAVVVASLTLVGLALGLAWWLRLGIQRQLIEASIRAAAQLLAVGLLFAIIFESTRALYWSWVWVVLMTAVATVVVIRRAENRIPRLGFSTALAVAGSALISIAVVFGFGVIDYDAVALVVVAGITIGNAVPSAVLGVNLSMASCRDRRGEIDALLSLGLDRRQIVRFLAPRTARSALLPQVERTKVVGLIALPGAMTGLLLAGVDPVEAVAVQLLVMYLVLGTAALCVVVSVVAVTRAAIADSLVVAEWVGNPEPPAGRRRRRLRNGRSRE
jgi:putative ABC transport system permease protein